MHLKKIEKIFPMNIEKYERFIPDISEGDVISKMNAVIQYLNRMGQITSDVVGNWNVVMKWVLDEGLTDEVTKKIDGMIDSGLFDQLISDSQAGWKAEVDSELTSVNKQLAQTDQRINKINAPKITPIEIIAHRGFAELAPENTMSAFSQAISLGANSLECDVQITSDGVPVVIHDDTVDRTTEGVGNVKDMTLSQLKALEAGSYFSPFYSGTKIPTFDEFLKYAKGRTLHIYPEIKDIRSIADIQLIVNSIKDNGMENVTVIQSFNLDHLLEVRKFSETIKLGLLIYNTALSQYAIDTLSNDGNAMILYGYSYIISNPSIVKQFYDLGIDLGVWVVPNKQTTLSLLELGVTKQMFDLYIGGIA